MNKKVIIGCWAFFFTSMFIFISINNYQAHQKELEIARIEMERKRKEATRQKRLAEEAEQLRIQELERLYTAKCSRDVDERYSHLYYTNRDLIPKVKRGCVLSAGDPEGFYKMRKQAEEKKIQEYVQRKLNRSRQTIPSGRDYGNMHRATEYRDHLFYQNTSPNMRPEQYR